MARSVRGTNTERNLLKAFARESQARNRYTYFADAAREEGFDQIAAVFTETAEHDKEHARVFFQYLEGGDVEIVASYPAGTVRDTKSNLEAAADGEKLEWAKLYADCAIEARGEGFSEIAHSFQQIAKVKRVHECRFRKLAADVARGEVFRKKSPVRWHCANCGYVSVGAEAPRECPVCKHTDAFYELLNEDFWSKDTCLI